MSVYFHNKKIAPIVKKEVEPEITGYAEVELSFACYSRESFLTNNNKYIYTESGKIGLFDLNTSTNYLLKEDYDVLAAVFQTADDLYFMKSGDSSKIYRVDTVNNTLKVVFDKKVKYRSFGKILLTDSKRIIYGLFTPTASDASSDIFGLYEYNRSTDMFEKIAPGISFGCDSYYVNISADSLDNIYIVAKNVDFATKTPALDIYRVNTSDNTLITVYEYESIQETSLYYLPQILDEKGSYIFFGLSNANSTNYSYANILRYDVANNTTIIVKDKTTTRNAIVDNNYLYINAIADKKIYAYNIITNEISDLVTFTDTKFKLWKNKLGVFFSATTYANRTYGLKKFKDGLTINAYDGDIYLPDYQADPELLEFDTYSLVINIITDNQYGYSSIFLNNNNEDIWSLLLNGTYDNNIAGKKTFIRDNKLYWANRKIYYINLADKSINDLSVIDTMANTNDGFLDSNNTIWFYESNINTNQTGPTFCRVNSNDEVTNFRLPFGGVIVYEDNNDIYASLTTKTPYYRYKLNKDTDTFEITDTINYTFQPFGKFNIVGSIRDQYNSPKLIYYKGKQKLLKNNYCIQAWNLANSNSILLDYTNNHILYVKD